MTKIMTALVVLDLVQKYTEIHKLFLEEQENAMSNTSLLERVVPLADTTSKQFQYSNKYKPKGIVHLDQLLKVPLSAAALNGTSAQLIGHDFLTIRQLMYGMMLPSGNDAAQALAIWFGAILLNDGKVDPNNFLHAVSRQAIDEHIREL